MRHHIDDNTVLAIEAQMRRHPRDTGGRDLCHLGRHGSELRPTGPKHESAIREKCIRRRTPKQSRPYKVR